MPRLRHENARLARSHPGLTTLRKPLRVFLSCLTLVVLPDYLQAIDENLTKGATTHHVFEAGAWGEYIDTLNGGLNLSIPLGPEFRVSPDVSYQVKLSYSSKVWRLNESNYNNNSRSRIHGIGQAGLGFSLHLGRIYTHAGSPDCKENEDLFEDSTGATHVAAGTTTDGSFLRTSHSDTSGTVTTPAGVTYYLTHKAHDLLLEPDPDNNALLPQCPNPVDNREIDALTNDYRGLYVTRIESKDHDPNVFVSVTYEGQGIALNDPSYHDYDGMRHLIKTITDSVGRTVTFTNLRTIVDDAGQTVTLSSGYVKSIAVPAFNGQQAIYTLGYKVKTIADPFVTQNPATSLPAADNPTGLFPNVLLLDSITFPNGYVMSFKYTLGSEPNSGLLRARVLPTGAQVEYDYESYPFAHQMCSGPRFANVTCSSTCQPDVCQDCGYWAVDPPFIYEFCGVQYSCGACPGASQPWCTNQAPGAEFMRWCGTTLLPGTFGLVRKRVIPDPAAPQEAAEWTWSRKTRTIVNVGFPYGFEERVLPNAHTYVSV